MTSYNTSSIFKMDELDHIRQNSGMYVGDSETATRLLEECLDNALDEVQGGYCNIIAIFVDTKNKTFKVLDNGRGIPFDQKKLIEEDTPVLICTNLFTSGKFKKGQKDSAYKVASGLHGVGMSCVYALSDWMNIEIYRDKKHATYNFNSKGEIERVEEKFNPKNEKPFSTKIEVKPSKKYFENNKIDLKRIEERLLIATVNFPKLKIAYVIDGKNKVIDGTVDDILKNYLTKNAPSQKWFTWERREKSGEYYKVKFCWEEEGNKSPKYFTTVNLCRVESGAHINNIKNYFKNVILNLCKKGALDTGCEYDFEGNDCFVGLRLYLDLGIIKPAFAEQVKDRLSSRSELNILEDFEEQLKNIIFKNKEYFKELLQSFDDYRKELKHKHLNQSNTNKKGKRGATKLTKLRDCSLNGGELIIGEGDSAINGLISVRNPKKHAVLPLRGKVPNSITKKDFAENKEFKDIVIACGCGMLNQCDINKLRYEKIIIACDADPDGKHIATLLITLFAYTMPDIIKNERLYLAETPLFGIRTKGKFIPLWTKEELDEARKKKMKITRFKGLGEMNPKDLKVFILEEENRRLTKVKWTENYESIFKLLSNSSEKRKLVLDEWNVEE
jgi:DNA gyrase/topoisomerase IV subunit B